MKKKIGIVGVPPLEIIRQINHNHYEIIDLDEPQLRLPIDQADRFLPKVYCAILRTVLLNALNLPLDRIYIDTGPGKCDCALHVAAVLKGILRIPVHQVRNTDAEGFGYPICRSSLPLQEKVKAIIQGVQSPLPSPAHPPCVPTAGFWGVPPRDLSLLKLFPDSTHVYGWTRCMENKTPAALDLEAHCNPSIPTVFFAQSFCAKTALAKHLAAQHPKALCVDCDVSSGSSTRAKIEAFLELSGVIQDPHAAG
jgi:hypothetical protein